MSASHPRGRGGSSTRGFRGTPNRGSTRGRGDSSRGGRGAPTATSGGHGLLQAMRTGTIPQGPSNGATTGGRGRGNARGSSTPAARGRGRGHLSNSFNNVANNESPSNSRPSSPFAPVDGGSNGGDVQQRYNVLKNLREEERREAIRMGFLADPEKKTTLDKAITPVGTCTELCPPYERVERIVQMMVDRCERIPDPHGGRPIASEEIMVKRFRRSAAGDDEQVPSDIRTPETLRKTLDYLVDKLVGGPERLAVVHKFTWDRTRAIRNDFSIQQVSKEEDVQIAVECFERIARFHIMALHQLSNPENLLEGENFDVFQEREQLNNTLLSLLYYYDDHRDQIAFPNEAEFRAYHIILAFQSQHPDIEDRVQSWPIHLIADNKVQTALRLYQAAGNTLFDQGPLKPWTPFPIAQNDSGRFWTIMASGTVGYTLACVTELYFNQVRFGALNALWRSCKSAPSAQQAKFRDWTLAVVSEYLGFDEDDQTVDFCANFGLDFTTDAQGVTYLDITTHKDPHLDQSSIPKEIVFSHTFVEDKRCRRSLVAIINNVRPADAIWQGMVEEGDRDAHHHQQEAEDDGQSLFIPESTPAAPKAFGFGSGAFNPQATSFNPSAAFGSGQLPKDSIFGSHATSAPAFGSGPLPADSIFGLHATSVPAPSSLTTPAAAPSAQSTSFRGSQSPNFGVSQPQQLSTSFGTQFGTPASSAPPLSTKFGGSATTPGTDVPPAWGAASASEATAPVPSSHGFGTSRPSVQENNPFGPNPAGKSKVAADAPTDAFAQSQPPSQFQPPVTYNTFPFGTPAAEAKQSAPANISQFSDAATDNSAQKESPFNFTFAKPALSTSATTSFAPQSTPAPQGLPSSSFTPQPPADTPKPQEQPPQPSTSSLPSFALPKEINFQFPSATSESKPTPFFQQPTQPGPPKPTFSFTPQAAPAADPSQVKSQPSSPPFLAGVPSQPIPPTPFSNLTPTSQQPAEQAPPPTLPNFNPAQPQFHAFPSQDKPNTAATEPSAGSKPASSLEVESTTPPLSPAQPQAPTQLPVDKAALVGHAARLSLTQSHGLLWQFLEYQLPAVLQRVLRGYQEEVRQATLDRLKSAFLCRKYGAIWRAITWRNNLNKRASKRRQMFSASLKMEAAKKRQHEDELNEILAAVEESKRMKEQMLQKQAEAKKVNDKKHDPAQLAGSKRKSLGEPLSGASPNITNRTGLHHHKRSRTIGSMLPPPPPPPASSSPAGQFRHSIFSGRSSLSRSSSTSNLRKSDMRTKQDETKTDYFRLVATGVDPETPFIPLTARQVEAKRRKEKEEREAAIARAYNRRRVGITPTQHSPSQVPTTTATPISPVVSIPSPQASTTGSTYDPEADELLQQLRKAREDLAEDTKWFKEQAEKIGKEVDEEENLRSSTSSQGLHIPERSQYAPPPAFGKSMSRVEQILQRSGKRSLAYKPLPGSNYIPVAMSRRSADRYYSQGEDVEEIETNGTAKKRRKRGDIDRSYRPSADELEADEQDMDISPQKRSKKHVLPAPAATSTRPLVAPPVLPALQYKPAGNKFAHLQQLAHEEGDELLSEDELIDEEEDDEDDDSAGGYGHYFGQNGGAIGHDLQDGPGVEFADEEDDSLSEGVEVLDDEEVDEEDDGDGYDYVGRHQLSKAYDEEEGEEVDIDTPTPNTQGATSRATSDGPGATADDAIALSDSD